MKAAGLRIHGLIVVRTYHSRESSVGIVGGGSLMWDYCKSCVLSVAADADRQSGGDMNRSQGRMFASTATAMAKSDE